MTESVKLMTRNSGIEYIKYPIPFFEHDDGDDGDGNGNDFAPINLR